MAPSRNLGRHARKHKAWRKLKNRYRRQYGVKWERLLEGQDNSCAICGVKFSKEKPPTLDHDHDTGEVRGALCRSCNWQLGLFEKRQEEFEDYLLKGGRPLRDDYFLQIARVVAKRGTCPRLRVGCVFVVETRMVAAGYNGAPRGMPHCIDEGCILGSDGGCTRTSHAEVNALAYAARRGIAPLDGATSYGTHAPCFRCSQLLITAGISRVVFNNAYRDPAGVELLNKGGVLVG